MSVNFPLEKFSQTCSPSWDDEDGSESSSLDSTLSLSPSMIEEEIEDTPFNTPPPGWIWSKNKLLSPRHLKYYLESASLENEKELILWSFSQRKFPSEPLFTDTICRPEGAHPIGGPDSPLVDEESNAISDSEHLPWTTEYFPYTLNVEPCVAFKKESDLYIGYYADGKCMIQQPGVRGCAIACIAMLLHDKGVKYNFPTLKRANVTTEKRFSDELAKYGYQSNPLNKEELINYPDPVFVNIISKQRMSHTMILDKMVDESKVIIRDPFHGWRIAVSMYDFVEEVQKAEYFSLKAPL